MIYSLYDPYSIYFRMVVGLYLYTLLKEPLKGNLGLSSELPEDLHSEALEAASGALLDDRGPEMCQQASGPIPAVPRKVLGSL